VLDEMCIALINPVQQTGVMETRTEPTVGRQPVRRSLREGDPEAIVDLHRRVYTPEFGMGPGFVAAVAAGIHAAVASGWPSIGGGVWLIDSAGQLSGALALTHEGDGVGRVRWFVLDPSLRGRGWGGSLFADLLDQARAEGLHRLELETFSALTTAARLYRRAGFRLVWERVRHDWGPPVTYQGYQLDLG
jgi:GNAT superfamily N-acetyltransferase